MQNNKLTESNYCKSHGIRLSGPKLGRLAAGLPSEKESRKLQKKLESCIKELQKTIVDLNRRLGEALEKYKKRNQEYYDVASQLLEMTG